MRLCICSVQSDPTGKGGPSIIPTSGEVIHADFVTANGACQSAVTTWCHEPPCFIVVKVSILLASVTTKVESPQPHERQPTAI